MAVSDFYPDPGTGGGNVTVDGTVRQENKAQTWATFIANATGTQHDDTDNIGLIIALQADNTLDQWDDLWKAILTFDTSTITSSATVSATSLSLEIEASTDDFTDAIAIVGATPASDNELINADFDQLGSTLFAPTLAIGSINDNVYNVFTFNATGIAAIVKDGITAVGALNESVRSDTEPPWGSGDLSQVFCWFADFTGTSSDPRLRVTHATSGATYTLECDSVPVTVAAQDASLLHNRVLNCDTVAVGVSAQDVGLYHGWRLNAETVQVAVAAQDVSLLKGWKLSADAVAVAVAIQNVNLVYSGEEDALPPWDVTSRLDSVPLGIERHEATPLGVTQHEATPLGITRHEADPL